MPIRQHQSGRGYPTSTRLPTPDRVRVEIAAQLRGVTLAEFLRQAVNREAAREIDRHREEGGGNG